MSRLRLLVLVGGLGTLLASGPVLACVAPDRGDQASRTTASTSSAALTLLETAAAVARSRHWTGTQSVVSTRGGMPSYTVMRVSHAPGAGSTLEQLAAEGRGVAPDLIDETLFRLLASHYDLDVVGPVLCDGRRTTLVEAIRPGRTGEAAVAGRFWVDVRTQMVLRRDVLDDTGAVVLSSTYLDLEVTGASPMVAVSHEAPVGERLEDAEVRELVDQGWPIVEHLPTGLELFEARRNGDGVLQLAYSDGLSTLSLFVQRGTLPKRIGGTLREVGGELVHVTSGTPEQLAWAGGGHAWTLVSDAPVSTIEQTVLVLPHVDPPVEGQGMADRVWRGMSRVGGWLNPFT